MIEPRFFITPLTGGTIMDLHPPSNHLRWLVHKVIPEAKESNMGCSDDLYRTGWVVERDVCLRIIAGWNSLDEQGKSASRFALWDEFNDRIRHRRATYS